MPHSISAVLTAAGESTRMGRPKPLLPWRGLTLVEYQAASLMEGGASEVVVVLGHLYQQVVPYVRGPAVRYVVNSNYRQGRATSIRAGIRAAGPGAEAILLLGVDQPRPPEIVAAVIDAHRNAGAAITSPRYEGRGGHPIVFSAALRGELEDITDEGQGLRQVFRDHRDEVNEVEFDDPIVRLDINSAEDYEAARARHDA